MSEWLKGWIRAGRLETPDALKNQDLWRQLASLSDKHQVSWEWVPGHAGHPFNERCDKLAKQAAEGGGRTVVAVDQPEIPENEQESATEPVDRTGEIPLQAMIPLASASDQPAAVSCAEVVVFDADDDGQFRLC
jgi:ribonuclease HI